MSFAASQHAPTAAAASVTELMAPAGDWDCLRAAVANGAHAVYFGLTQFNARHRAANFTPEELPQVIEYLHARNVRGYVTFNTLIFSDELPAATQMIATIAAAGAAAVIVQDWGLAELVHRVAPQLAIHGSTQMTLTEPRGIELARQLGVERVVLARELSLDDIGRIVAATTMPLEVFVHGALCVAYSGQCLTSEALGGRSANRGQCAQACRLPYELIVDGRARDTGDRNYLLSPQDLAAYDLVEPLVKLGVSSLKIEGRLKSPDYVAITTQTYADALAKAQAAEPFELDAARRIDLEQSFSRGFSQGFLGGLDHQTLVPARFPKARGIYLGTVAARAASGIVVRLAPGVDPQLLKPGDGIVLDEGHPEQDEQGGRVYSVTPLRPTAGGAAELEVTLAHGSVNLAAVRAGSLVWRTHDPTLHGRMRQSYARDPIVRRQSLHMRLSGQLGGVLTLIARDDQGRQAESRWAGPLAAARTQPWTRELVVEQLGRMGDTPYELGALELELPAEAMLPKSVLNTLRREAIEALERGRQRAPQIRPAALEELRSAARAHSCEPRSTTAPEISLSVLVRSVDQLAAVLDWSRTLAGESDRSRVGAGFVYCDFEDVRRYREAVALAREEQRRQPATAPRIGLATMRIQKPGEEGLLKQIAKCEPDAALVRNLTAISYFRDTAPQLPQRGDFSLNVANELSASFLLRQGLASLTPSYDLNWQQLSDLCGRLDPRWLEVTIHQHMPMFHMEHCVFAAMLSNGKDWRDCGRPCDRHRVELRDRAGANFPLKADTGCRNTVFNSLPQSAAEFLPRMLAAGLRSFRVDLLQESPDQVASLLDRYRGILLGREAAKNSWRQLQVLSQLGVTRGTLGG